MNYRQLTAAARLASHDLKIVFSVLRTVMVRPIDLITILLTIPIFILIWRAWLADQPEWVLKLQAWMLGLFIAFYAAKILADRCEYHACDGILASCAQDIRTLLAYALPFWVSAIGASLSVLLLLQTGHIEFWLIGAIVGGIVGAGWRQLFLFLSAGCKFALSLLKIDTFSRSANALVRVCSGAAIGLFFAVVPLKPTVVLIGSAVVSVIGCIVLGRANAEVIRFQTMLGHKPWRLVCGIVLRLLSFLAPFTTVLFLASHWGAATAVGAITVLGATLISFSILANQAFGKEMGDLVVVGVVGLSASLGSVFPALGGAILLTAIVWLARRASRELWLVP